MDERRRNIRTGVAIELQIHWPSKNTLSASSINYSHGGVLMHNPFGEIPAVGTHMTVQVTTLIYGKEAPVLPVIVIRASQDEIAFQFS